VFRYVNSKSPKWPLNWLLEMGFVLSILSLAERKSEAIIQSSFLRFRGFPQTQLSLAIHFSLPNVVHFLFLSYDGQIFGIGRCCGSPALLEPCVGFSLPPGSNTCFGNRHWHNYFLTVSYCNCQQISGRTLCFVASGEVLSPNPTTDVVHANKCLCLEAGMYSAVQLWV
jgi:hypothetical protein